LEWVSGSQDLNPHPLIPKRFFFGLAYGKKEFRIVPSSGVNVLGQNIIGVGYF
jgi:hypothetical protein